MLKNLLVGFNPLFYKFAGLKALFWGGVISDPRAEARGNSIIRFLG
jgi:hypothetical protein